MWQGNLEGHAPSWPCMSRKRTRPQRVAPSDRACSSMWLRPQLALWRTFCVQRSSGDRGWRFDCPATI